MQRIYNMSGRTWNSERIYREAMLVPIYIYSISNLESSHWIFFSRLQYGVNLLAQVPHSNIECLLLGHQSDQGANERYRSSNGRRLPWIPIEVGQSPKKGAFRSDTHQGYDHLGRHRVDSSFDGGVRNKYCPDRKISGLL